MPLTLQCITSCYWGCYVPTGFLMTLECGRNYSQLDAYAARGYQQLDPLVLSHELHTILYDTWNISKMSCDFPHLELCRSSVHRREELAHPSVWGHTSPLWDPPSLQLDNWIALHLHNESPFCLLSYMRLDLRGGLLLTTCEAFA